MHFRLRMQLAVALGPDNRWYCSEAHGKPIHDPELLMIYFISSGGAADFAHRYSEAMGVQNRWYCSERHGYDVRDPKTLWDYYMKKRLAAARGGELEREAEEAAELSLV